MGLVYQLPQQNEAEDPGTCRAGMGGCKEDLYLVRNWSSFFVSESCTKVLLLIEFTLAPSPVRFPMRSFDNLQANVNKSTVPYTWQEFTNRIVVLTRLPYEFTPSRAREIDAKDLPPSSSGSRLSYLNPPASRGENRKEQEPFFTPCIYFFSVFSPWFSFVSSFLHL
ncbi:hypothetical protein VNO77_03672 [Canavalia gladiata]|uniref:Uncharacterized protein n=1 Tax=Canavalia gladiata TaxID=3824 RepID=A0AAN9MVR2_CANGL